MIRWYRRPRPLAPYAVLVLRAVGGLAAIAAYAVFRAPYLTSVWEATATWIGAVVCLWLAVRSLEQLAVLHRDRIAAGEPSPLELTDVLPTPVPRTPVAMLDDTDRFRIHGEVFAGTVAFEQSRAKLIDRGEVVEPQLFTHEYNPLTPPHGIELPNTPHRQAKAAAMRAAYTPSSRHRADDEAPQESGGRHRLADAQLNRERAHGQFGVW